MKKLLNISVIAALAILPLAANATDLTDEQLAYANPTTDDGTTVATAQYVKGAYNELGKAINTKQDKLTPAQLKAIQDVSGLDTRLGTAETNIEALKTAVGNATAGLVKDVADLQTNKQDKLSDTQLNAVNSGITSKKVTDYDNLVTNSANFITKDVDNLTNYTTTTAMNTALADKQDKLSETQLKAVDSGITSEKVTDYDNLVTTSANFITKDVDNLTNYTTTAGMNTALAKKADAATTYTKTEVDTALDAKANAATTYTKTEVDTELAKKQDSLTTDQLAAVDSKITAEKVALYDNLARDSENYATKDGVTATINASSVSVPVLTTWGDNTAKDMEASIIAAAYTEPVAASTEPAPAGEQQ